MQSQCTPSGAAVPAQARRLHPAAGFTLLELMAVLVLIGLLATVGIPNLIRAKIRAEMLAQVKTLRQSMAVARINAIKGGQPVALSMQNVGGVATLVAWVDADGGQDFDSGERVVGQWTLPNKFSLTEDPDNQMFQLGGTGPNGFLFLPSGTAIVAPSGEIGAGQAGAVLTDIKGNQFLLLVTGGAGTVEEKMWNPDIGDWDAKSRNHWRY